MDGRWQVIIRGQTIDPLVRDFERLFNTRVLDTARSKEKKRRLKLEREGGGGTEKETDRRGRKGESFDDGAERGIIMDQENVAALLRECKGARRR